MATNLAIEDKLIDKSGAWLNYGNVRLGQGRENAKQFLRDKLLDHKNYIYKHGEDLPEIRNWKWRPGKAARSARDF